MITKVVLDKFAKNAKQGKIGKISKQVGDTVRIGEKILNTECVKGNSVIKSKVNGKIVKILVEEGSKAKVGDLLAEIEKDD
ncbi:biotin/lipoyl-containing protein [Clostridium sp. DL1XJH146]